MAKPSNDKNPIIVVIKAIMIFVFHVVRNNLMFRSLLISTSSNLFGFIEFLGISINRKFDGL